jgi:CheY-like chemotaxis protein
MELNEATLLVVDDERELREFIVQWFERVGARVVTAGHGEEALDVVSKNPVDLIISDIRMPVMDGIAMARRIRTTEKYIPKMIFISGFSDCDSRELYELGVEATLRKPTMRKTLIEAARHCLADKHERWREPLAAAPTECVSVGFKSLPNALGDGMIAFGRGGFCLHSSLAAHDDEPIALNLTFEAEHRALRGQGIVRWTDCASSLIGIELTYLERADCAWFVELTCHEDIRSFIPGRCAAGADPQPLHLPPERLSV